MAEKQIQELKAKYFLLSNALSFCKINNKEPTLIESLFKFTVLIELSTNQPGKANVYCRTLSFNAFIASIKSQMINDNLEIRNYQGILSITEW